MPKARPTGPLCTRDSLAADLRTAGLRPGETVLVHSSLSALGWVCGGAETVVLALLDVLGEDGTLVVPAHSGGNSDPAEWSNPPVPEAWQPQIRASLPAYDPRTTATLGVGVIPEVVRNWPGAVRSAHPQTSFAAVGPRATQLTDGHALDCRLGEHSPLARLEEAGARVLLLGAGFDSCTAFHLAEYRIPGQQVGNSFAAMTPAGRRWTTVRDVPVSDDRFDELGAAFERERPVERGTVGAAEARLFPLADAVAYAGAWLAEHRPRSAPGAA
ncbi:MULTISPECIES: AAC(3) family N-acetyltransferase [unclassified Streptomyces]|uniref:aminoglycoside N(3)-acetyltransferase n=1 Tax=unclassified Streptomyces TaxID=2593676 RepID=UPI002DD92D7E|nr:AAC(3) family N-acetyltransferase [Streptomyces sp. NBC_01766]WSC21460.1 AAC(3) family N-acetyltransferase [Streptomyces sp. NBC_01766]WSV55399.1 AAC(3) family N-acetyltransferase [Streptomyces sp. NBC_01014]